MASSDDLLSEYLRHQKLKNEEEEEKPSCKNKPLHVINHEQTEEVPDLKRLYRWFKKAGLKDSRGTNHKQALSTRSIEANIFHIRQVQAVQRCSLRQTNRAVLFI